MFSLRNTSSVSSMFAFIAANRATEFFYNKEMLVASEECSFNAAMKFSIVVFEFVLMIAADFNNKK